MRDHTAAGREADSGAQAPAAPAASAALPVSRWSSSASRTRRRPKVVTAGPTRSRTKLGSGSWTAARMSGANHSSGRGWHHRPARRDRRWRSGGTVSALTPSPAVAEIVVLRHRRLSADQGQKLPQQRFVPGRAVDSAAGQRLARERAFVHRCHRRTLPAAPGSASYLVPRPERGGKPPRGPDNPPGRYNESREPASYESPAATEAGGRV